MSLLKILQYPDLRLRNKALQVESVKSPSIQKIIHDMLETLAHANDCAALAATQLDLVNPPAITVIKPPNPELNTEILCLINPQIIESNGECTDVEGCMSIYPNIIKGHVKRAKKIKVRAMNQKGETVEIYAEDFLSRCIQHEIDHLNGIIYLDHLSSLKRKLVEKKISRLSKLVNN